MHFENDAYFNGESLRTKIEATFNISLGHLRGHFIKHPSTLDLVSRRLTIETNPPLDLTISRKRIEDYRHFQPTEHWQALRRSQTQIRIEYIYPDEAVEYLLSHGLPITVFVKTDLGFLNFVIQSQDYSSITS